MENNKTLNKYLTVLSVLESLLILEESNHDTGSRAPTAREENQNADVTYNSCRESRHDINAIGEITSTSVVETSNRFGAIQEKVPEKTLCEITLNLIRTSPQWGTSDYTHCESEHSSLVMKTWHITYWSQPWMFLLSYWWASSIGSSISGKHSHLHRWFAYYLSSPCTVSHMFYWTSYTMYKMKVTDYNSATGGEPNCVHITKMHISSLMLNCKTCQLGCRIARIHL